MSWVGPIVFLAMHAQTKHRQRLTLVYAAAAALTLLWGCSASHAQLVQPSQQSASAAPAESVSSTTASSATPEQKAYPTTPAEAEALKKKGIAWSNEETRVYYLKLADSVDASNEQWKQEGLSAEKRAQRAWEVRHNARITARAMMGDPREVEDLRARDQEKYGNPDGPTFEQLVEGQRKKGLTGDAVYEAIIGSSQRTDPKTNEKFNLNGSK